MTPHCWLQQRVTCLPLGFTGLLQETHIMSAPSIACACCVAGQMSCLLTHLVFCHLSATESKQNFILENDIKLRRRRPYPSFTRPCHATSEMPDTIECTYTDVNGKHFPNY